MTVLRKTIPSLVGRAERLWRIHRQKFRADREARRAFRASAPPVLVYQMGKVGSRTVVESLNRADQPHPVLHLHILTDELPTLREAAMAEGHIPVSYHFDLGIAVRRELRRFAGRCKIISLVRDPIAREISSVFQTPKRHEERYGISFTSDDGDLDADAALRLVEEHLHRQSSFEWALQWFDRELKAVLEVDVLLHEFPVNRGWTIVQEPVGEVLLLRLEDLSRVGSRAIQEFLAIDAPLELASANVRSRSIAVYHSVRDRVRLRRDICEWVYANPVVRHFYSDTMIQRFIQRWTQGDR